MSDPINARLAAIRERAKPGTAVTLNKLIAASTTRHPHAGAEPVIVQGCVVTSAQHLRDTLRQVWFTDIPALLAAVEAALNGHEPMNLYSIAHIQNGEISLCGHDSADEDAPHVEDDDGAIICLDKPQGRFCRICWDEGGDRVKWPCPQYEAIAAALSGGGEAE